MERLNVSSVSSGGEAGDTRGHVPVSGDGDPDHPVLARHDAILIIIIILILDNNCGGRQLQLPLGAGDAGLYIYLF